MSNFNLLFKRFINKTEKPLINILTRTSARPKGFHKCHNSIKRQSYGNWKHIVSYDSIEDRKYLEGLDILKIEIDKTEILLEATIPDPGTGPFSPHNLYCNKLLDEVKEGWIMFLDDDDMLAHKDVLKELSRKIKKVDEDMIFIWQMKYPNGKHLPGKDLLRRKEIKLYNIGSPCFLFHSKYAPWVRWDSWKCADYRFLEQLFKIIPNKQWIEEPYVLLNNFGGLGSKIDIE